MSTPQELMDEHWLPAVELFRRVEDVIEGQPMMTIQVVALMMEASIYSSSISKQAQEEWRNSRPAMLDSVIAAMDEAMRKVRERRMQ